MRDEDGETEGGERRRGIQSVEIGFRVLEALAKAGGPVTLSALGARAELSPSQTHRYLQSLLATGLVSQNMKSGQYDLGPSARSIGLAALSRFDALAAADEVLGEFVAEAKWTALLAVWGVAGPTLIRWYKGRPQVITNLGLGSLMPLYFSATGHAFLTFGDEAEIGEQARREARETSGGGLDLAALRADARRRMFTQLGGRFIPGLRAVSAPIFDIQGRLLYAATAIANAAFPESDDPAVGAALSAACRRITEMAGGAWPADTVPPGDRAS